MAAPASAAQASVKVGPHDVEDPALEAWYLETAQDMFLLTHRGTKDVSAIKEKLLKTAKERHAAPLYRAICEATESMPDAAVIKEMEDATAAELKVLNDELAAAIENEGESEIRSVLYRRARLHMSIMDKPAALAAFDETYAKTVPVGQKLDVVFCKLRIGLYDLDHALLKENFAKAKELLDAGGDWERRNRLKVRSSFPRPPVCSAVRAPRACRAAFESRTAAGSARLPRLFRAGCSRRAGRSSGKRSARPCEHRACVVRQAGRQAAGAGGSRIRCPPSGLFWARRAPRLPPHLWLSAFLRRPPPHVPPSPPGPASRNCPPATRASAARPSAQVYEALSLISVRDFKQAATLLIDSVATFTAAEVCSCESPFGVCACSPLPTPPSPSPFPPCLVGALACKASSAGVPCGAPLSPCTAQHSPPAASHRRHAPPRPRTASARDPRRVRVQTRGLCAT